MARPTAIWDFVDFLLDVLEVAARGGGGEVGDSGMESVGDVEWFAENGAGVDHHLAPTSNDGVSRKCSVV